MKRPLQIWQTKRYLQAKYPQRDVNSTSVVVKKQLKN